MTAPEPPDLSPSDPVDPTARALQHLERFRRIVLPSFLRHCRQWNGLDARRHADVIEDLEQELALDCVAHAAEIDALEPVERHRRWLRLAQRVDYEIRVRDRRRSVQDATTIESAVPPPSPIDLDLAPADAELFGRLASQTHVLGNGRLCVLGTARALRVGRARLQRLWSEVARRLGVDAQHATFWQRRLAEALCMVAAARLRADGVLHVWDDARRRPYDDAAFWRRIARIRTELTRSPADPEIRKSLDRIAPRSRTSLPKLSAREILALAAGLAPTDAAILQWRFEAELLAGDLAEAARCVRRARRVEPDRVRGVLARARLLEVRGRSSAARALLARAVGRLGPDPRLCASLDALGGAPRRYAPSSTRSAAISSRSHSA